MHPLSRTTTRHNQEQKATCMPPFPEVAAGGYSRYDGTIEFYTRVRSLLPPGAIVLDFGAGRASFLETEKVPFRRGVQDLRDATSVIHAVDVDPKVLSNPLATHTHLYDGKVLPLDDDAVDLVVADFVLEHLADPATSVHELRRVTRPGGWICARTPNKWGYIGVGARVVPNSMHKRFLRELQPERAEVDVFPTRYNANTRTRLRTLFPSDRFTLVVYGHPGDPSYIGRSRFFEQSLAALNRITPELLAPMLLVFARKIS